MINAIRLSDIDKKFKRYHGWSGADGIYTYNYNGEILMYFSDTFIGDSNELDERLTFDLINNSLALIKLSLSILYLNQLKHSHLSYLLFLIQYILLLVLQDIQLSILH